MFICVPCYKKATGREEPPRIFRSRGQCEDCNVVSDCLDIPTSIMIDLQNTKPAFIAAKEEDASKL